MSTNDPGVTFLELMKLERDKYQNMKREMEKVVIERDSLKKEVEELTLKKMMYKTRAREWKAMATLSGSAGIPSSPTPFSTKRTRQDDASISGTKEAAGHTDRSEQHSNVQTKSFQIYGTTSLIPLIIDKIKRNLKKETFEKFQQSCFGHLLEIGGELKYQGKLVLHLLMHMDMSVSNTEKIVFKINNSNIEFRPREFSLITGLRLGTLEAATAATTAATASSSSIQEKVFMGKYPILMKDIKDQFLNFSRIGKDGDEMPLKLALLYFLYGILLAGQHQSKQVDLQYLPLIDDLKAFNAFPWGCVAYEFLASSMLSARSRIDDPKVCYHSIFGFSAALQIWAYEVMPSVAAYCAVRANGSVDQIPRILRWSTLKKKVCFRDLQKFFTPGDEAQSVLDGIRASPWELEALTTGTLPPQPKKETWPSHGVQMSLSAMPTTHTVPPQPKKEILFGVKGQISSDAEKATSSVNDPTYLRACVLQSEMQRQPLMERCWSSAAGDVVIIGDSDSDDDEAPAAVANSQSKDSDAKLPSDSHMKKFLAELKREAGSI